MKKTMSVGEAVDDFAQNVFPNLFKEGRKGNNGYYRVKNLLYARAAEVRGESPRRRVTADWAQSILNDYAPGRYTFQHHTTVTLNDGQ